MQIIENLKVKEKVYIEKLKNGLTVMIIPKKNTHKKYAIFGTHFGSIDNRFVAPGQDTETQIPDGVAHFLEHKMFEQENGTNSLDTLSALGVDANAYTTNDHTAYLFECTENFDEALAELMNYVQNPYFTDENVEKEKGIIGQEITMYDDDPASKVFLNILDCLYQKNPIKLDVAGTIDSISKITKETLYTCYNTFYNPSNMALVLCGDFKPEELIEQIKKYIVDKPMQGEIKRIYPEEPEEIKQQEKEERMEVSKPIFVIGIKDKVPQKEEIVKRHIAVEIILHIIIGESSNLYKKLYEQGYLISEPNFEYEFAKEYAHIIISGQSKDPHAILQMLKEEIKQMKQEGIQKETFDRIKRKLYGNYITDYNEVALIARMFLSDYFNNINSFDYLEEYETVTIEYAEQVLKEVMKEEKMAISVVRAEE